MQNQQKQTSTSVKVFFPMDASSINGARVRSLGDPTKFIRGNSNALFLGVLGASNLNTGMCNEYTYIYYK